MQGWPFQGRFRRKGGRIRSGTISTRPVFSDLRVSIGHAEGLDAVFGVIEYRKTHVFNPLLQGPGVGRIGTVDPCDDGFGNEAFDGLVCLHVWEFYFKHGQCLCDPKGSIYAPCGEIAFREVEFKE